MQTKIQKSAKALDNYFNAKTDKKHHNIEDIQNDCNYYQLCIAKSGVKTISDLQDLANTCETEVKFYIESEVEYYPDVEKGII